VRDAACPNSTRGGGGGGGDRGRAPCQPAGEVHRPQPLPHAAAARQARGRGRARRLRERQRHHVHKVHRKPLFATIRLRVSPRAAPAARWLAGGVCAWCPTVAARAKTCTALLRSAAVARPSDPEPPRGRVALPCRYTQNPSFSLQRPGYGLAPPPSCMTMISTLMLSGPRAAAAATLECTDCSAAGRKSWPVRLGAVGTATCKRRRVCRCLLVQPGPIQ